MQLFALIFINLLLQLLNRPKSNVPKYSLTDFQMPTATEDRVMPMVYGTVPVAGNVVWYGDLQTREVTKSVSGALGLFSQDVPVGYKYYIGMQMSLAAAPVDALVGLYHGDKLVWSGNQVISKEAYTDLTINGEYTAAVGDEVPTGVGGTFRFYNRLLTAPVLDPSQYTPLENTYLKQQLKVTQLTDYPNTCHVVLLGPSSGQHTPSRVKPTWAFANLAGQEPSGFVGNSNSVQALRFVVKRLPDVKNAVFMSTLSNRPLSYPIQGSWADAVLGPQLAAFIDSVSDIGGDANPAFVIAEILCTRIAGLGPRLSPNTIDQESFLRAAKTLHDEGMGCSFAWENTKTVGDVLGDLCEQIGGFIEISERTGYVKLKLARETDEAVASFNSSSITKIDSFTRTVLTEAPNEIVVPFVDRNMNFQTRNIAAQNLAAITQAGNVISQQKQFLGVAQATVASMIATRELRALSTSLAQMKFTGILPPDVVLKPGDVIDVTHSRLGQQLRMRVTSATWADYSRRQEVAIEAIEDVFRAGAATLAVTTYDPGVPSMPTAPSGALTPFVVAAPYGLTGSDTDRAMYYAECEDAGTTRYEVASQASQTTWSDTVQPLFIDGQVSPSLGGAVLNTISTTDRAPSVQVALSDAAVSIFNSTTAPRTYLVAVGSEWLASTNAALSGNTLTLSGCMRGVFDTAPTRIVAGAHATVIRGVAIDTQALTGPVVYRAMSKGPGGVQDVSLAVQSTASIQPLASPRAIAPLSPRGIQLAGAGGVGNSLETAPTITRPTGTTQNVSLTWFNRNRLSRALEDFYSATDSAEVNTSVYWYVSFETAPGSGQFGSETQFTATATAKSGQVNVASAPVAVSGVGALVRIRVQTVRNDGGALRYSPLTAWYWRLSA